MSKWLIFSWRKDITRGNNFTIITVTKYLICVYWMPRSWLTLIRELKRLPRMSSMNTNMELLFVCSADLIVWWRIKIRPELLYRIIWLNIISSFQIVMKYLISIETWKIGNVKSFKEKWIWFLPSPTCAML